MSQYTNGQEVSTRDVSPKRRWPAEVFSNPLIKELVHKLKASVKTETLRERERMHHGADLFNLALCFAYPHDCKVLCQVPHTLLFARYTHTGNWLIQIRYLHSRMTTWKVSGFARKGETGSSSAPVVNCKQIYNSTTGLLVAFAFKRAIFTAKSFWVVDLYRGLLLVSDKKSLDLVGCGPSVLIHAFRFFLKGRLC